MWNLSVNPDPYRPIRVVNDTAWGVIRHPPFGMAVLTALAVSVVLPAGQTAVAIPVTVTLIDGVRLTGTWLGSDDGSFITVRIHGDRREHIPVDGITELLFDTKSVPDETPHRFHLADGSVFNGKLVGEIDDGFLATCVLGREVSLPFRITAGIQLSKDAALRRSSELFKDVLAKRLPGEDMLVTRHVHQPKLVRGILEQIDPDGGQFSLAGRSRKFTIDKVYGFALAAGLATLDPGPIRVTLADGSIVVGTLLGGGEDALRLKTLIGQPVALAVDTITRVDVTSARVVYLDERTPIDESVEGILHQPWPWRKRQNVSAGPIIIDGRRFARGIGCHSRTRLTYELDRQFESFAATIGIDDAVRPRGRVVYIVLTDGEERFNSGVVGGVDEPRDILVDVSDVDNMTLVVDYGPGLDLSDHANWGAARLLRPSQATMDATRR